MANLLGKLFFKKLFYNNRNFLFPEVSRGDEIMPAIKTLKLLAHGEDHFQHSDIQPSHSLTHTTSLNSHRNLKEKILMHSKSLQTLSSGFKTEQLNNINQFDNSERQSDENEEQQAGTEDEGS